MNTIRDLEFIVLGSGTSSGVPVIGCDCDVCHSDDPRDCRLRTAAAIRFVDADGHPRTVLIDASPDLRQQVLRAGLDRCDAILFTHNHVDHTFGLDEVRRFNVTMKAPIEVYAEPHTMAHLERVYQHIFHRERNVNDSFVATLLTHELTPGRVINLFGLLVEPVRLLHGRLPILGFRFDVEDRKHRPNASDDEILPLAWCTDVSAIPPEAWPRLSGLETLFLDLLRPRHHPTHFNTDQAIATASSLAATRTCFIHMAHDVGHAAQSALLPEGMELAYDGLVLRSFSSASQANRGSSWTASREAAEPRS